MAAEAGVMLDTNAVSDFLKKRSRPLLDRVALHAARHGQLTTSALTIFEVTRGFHRINQPLRAAAFLTTMATWEVLPFDVDAAEIAGHIEAELRINGTPIEEADILIASVAVAAHRVLVTHNVKHFEPIAALGYALPIEDWTLPP